MGGGLLVAYLLDLVVGDPRRLHPVACFGGLAARLARALYAPSRARGALLAAVLVGGAAAVAELLARRTSRPAALAATTWVALGGRSLRHEARHLAELIDGGQLAEARAGLRSLCGRDATRLNGAELCRAVVESVAENTSDAVVAPLMWGALGGAPAVAAHRAANTLDAMFGHRSERYLRFGWAPARLDDLMNWPAARLSALLVALVAPLAGGSAAGALSSARRYGGQHPSPNAGRIEAAFAGALGLRLGGPLSYAGHLEHRPHLGDGRQPHSGDIERASRLSLLVGAAAAGLSALVAGGRR